MGLGLWKSSGGGNVTPLSIFSSALHGFWHADFGIAHVANAISQWNDTGYVGTRHATQSSATLKPTYNASNALFSGKASVDFDGASDTMDIVSSAQVLPFTVYVLMVNRSTTNVYKNILHSGSATAPSLYSSTGTAGSGKRPAIYWDPAPNNDYSNAAQEFTGTTPSIVRYRVAAASQGIRVENNVESSVAHARSVVGTWAKMSSPAGSQHLHGDVRCVAIVQGITVSAEQDEAMMVYLQRQK
jgi:hypothetical protein